MTRQERLQAICIASIAALAAGCGQDERAGLHQTANRPAALVQSEVLPTGGLCVPNGAHLNHANAGFDCKVCHLCGGVLQFDPAGPAIAPGQPPPAFDAVAKTCSNVACHTVPLGTFSFPSQGGDGEVYTEVVTYGGAPPRVTPSWYTTGSACTACHDNPPRNGSNGSNVWHSGNHGNQGPTGARNQCQFCHPAAYSPNNGIGTVMVHRADKVVQVQAPFISACFGCH